MTDEISTDEQEINSSGTKTLLYGPPGSGKSTALTTFLEADIELFVIGTDPGFEESILDAIERKGLPMDKFHYNYVGPANAPWNALIAAAKQVNMFGYDQLSTLKSGINKSDYNQYITFLQLMENFIDKRTKKEFGPVDEFPENVCLAVDSLSGVNVMAMDLMIGGKPTAHQGEWGVAMNMEEKFVLKFTSGLKCFGVLTAHVEKEPDILTGIPITTVGALGKKLGPKLPRTFSDVIMAVKEGDKFSWSTAITGADLKTRSLPIKDGLQPSFVPIVERWRQRNLQK